VTDEQLVQAAAELARATSRHEVELPLYEQLLAAAAAQRSEQQRHELARQAAERAGAISSFALQLLTTTIFALA